MGRTAPLIVVVDDEASIGRALVRLLRSAHYRAQAFGSASEFLASLNTCVPDCVVLDLHMPVMTGLELQEALGGLERRPPVIVITAHDEPAARDRCLALGASYFLRKPVEGDALLRAIESVIDEPRQGLTRPPGAPAPSDAP
jgi:FixJ family two-component response regulator